MSEPVKKERKKQVHNSGLGISFQNLNLLHFDQIISLKSLLINLFLLARLNLGLQLMRLRVKASQKALCLEREREKGRKRERERSLFKQCLNLSAGQCAAAVQLFKWFRNLSAGTVLQWCSWSLDISAHNNFGPCQFRPITKSAYTISAHMYNNV